MRGRGRGCSEFKASLVYIVSSKAARTTWKNPAVSNKKLINVFFFKTINCIFGEHLILTSQVWSIAVIQALGRKRQEDLWVKAVLCRIVSVRSACTYAVLSHNS